jgi:16S rRNA (guanine(966)-N(2))-methyltransferase RsmD
MRIISGALGGRRIQPPSHMPYTRPTTDVAKEGLFNVIQTNLVIEDLTTLDLFGGTGCISFELFSRGARDLTIVEKDRKMHKFIQDTAHALKVPLKLIMGDVFKYIQLCNRSYDFIFAGPPYSLGNIDELPLLIFKYELLSKGGWFVLEHTPRNDYKKFAQYSFEKKYGTTIFSVFKK